MQYLNKKEFIKQIELKIKNIKKTDSNKDQINNILIDIDYYKYNDLNEYESYIIKAIIIDSLESL